MSKTGEKLMRIPIERIKADPKTNPRKRFDREDKIKLDELISSIKSKGVVVPVIVRPDNGKYQLVCGFRRFRAARNLKMSHLLAVVRMDLDDQGVAELQAIENLQREGLDIVDEARGFKDMLKRFGWRIEDIADKVGKSRKYVGKRLVILDAPDYVLEALSTGRITLGHAIALRGIQDEAEQKQAFKDATDFGWSVQQTLNRARERRINTKTPFDVSECKTCRWFGPNQGDLLKDEIGKKAAGDTVCRNKACFTKKLEAAREKVAKKYRDQKMNVEFRDQYSYADHSWIQLTRESRKGLKFPKKCKGCRSHIISIKDEMDGGFSVKEMCQKPKCSNWKVAKGEATRKKAEKEIRRKANEKLDQLMLVVQKKINPNQVSRLIIRKFFGYRSKGDPSIKAFIKRFEIDPEPLKKGRDWEFCDRLLEVVFKMKTDLYPKMIESLVVLDLRHGDTELLEKIAKPPKPKKKKGEKRGEKKSK